VLAIGLCILAFCTCYLAGRRSAWVGLCVLLTWGYFYGILRANILSAPAHFIFDTALIGFYLSQFLTGAKSDNGQGHRALTTWMIILVGWPCLLVLLPFQDVLVSLVGLRGNVFFLPICLIGARLNNRHLTQLAIGLATLNLIAIGFAVAQYVFGIERFYPVSAVTAIIYASRDVGDFHRIPAIFVNAHNYAGTMVMTLPFLVGAWIQVDLGRRFRLLLLAGIIGAFVGILLANTRIHLLVAGMLLSVFIFSTRGRAVGWYRIAWCTLVLAVAFTIINSERLGTRLLTLSDTDYVSERIQGSVNRTFLEILLEYPMGNGLGGGGTSMPYFLAGLVRTPIAMESEYARILLEQGIIGLLLWVAFILWFVVRSFTIADGLWSSSRRMGLVACCAYLGAGMIGIGLLTSIPQTVLMLMCIGWLTIPPRPDEIRAIRRDRVVSTVGYSEVATYA